MTNLRVLLLNDKFVYITFPIRQVSCFKYQNIHVFVNILIRVVLLQINLTE